MPCRSKMHIFKAIKRLKFPLFSDWKDVHVYGKTQWKNIKKKWKIQIRMEGYSEWNEIFRLFLTLLFGHI